MNATEKPKRIRAKREELVNQFPPCESTYGWRSTIAAINGLLARGAEHWPEAENILAAWPNELLE